MYGIFTNTYPKNHPNVGKYSIHRASGIYIYMILNNPSYTIIISPAHD